MMILRGLLSTSLQRTSTLGPRSKSSGFFLSSRSIFYRMADDDIPTVTIDQVIKGIFKLVGAPLSWSPKEIHQCQQMRLKLSELDLLPRDQSELPTRSMRDSFDSCIIPLGSDPSQREKYVTSYGTVRIGRIIEDLDYFSGHICYKHISNPKARVDLPNPYSIVTALVDSFHFSLKDRDRILIDEDIRISGHISTAGKSSMEVSILVDQKNRKGEWIKVTNALFVMVARDPANKGSAIINKLVPETPQEEAFMLRGAERTQKRKVVISGANNVPTGEEIDLVHKMLMERPVKDFRRMDQSFLETIVLCHPENRNVFYKIFGGFIMRQAVEVAFTLGLLYARSLPRVLDIDDVIFKSPVDIGSLLGFRAMVGYVDGKHLHIPVVAERINPSTGRREVTNIFRFNFKCTDVVPPLFPNTYKEGLTYLDSRRHFMEMMKRPNYF